MPSDPNRSARSLLASKMWAETPRRIPGAIPHSDEWLPMRQAAMALECEQGAPGFRALWERLAKAAEAGEVPDLDGVGIRMAACHIKGVDRWCIHRRHVMILANHVGPRRSDIPVSSAIPVSELLAVETAFRRPSERTVARIDGAVAKSARWLSYREMSVRYGFPQNAAAFKAAWHGLVLSAQAGGKPVMEGVPVRLAPCRGERVDYWCLHADDADAFMEAYRKPRRWAPRPEGYLTWREALAGVGAEAGSDLLTDAWRGLVGQARKGETPVCDGSPVRVVLHADGGINRWLIHADDVDGIVASAKGNLPRVREGYLSPVHVCSLVTRDARSDALRLLERWSKAETPSAAALDPECPPRVRVMLVAGKAEPCLRKDCLPAFMDALRDLSDRETLQNSAFVDEHDDPVASLPSLRF